MNDIHFQTPSPYANIKNSQNSAAKFTLTHFCPPQDGSCASGSDGVKNPHDVASTKSSQDVKLLYKNQLVNVPVHSCEKNKAKVSVDGQAFEGRAKEELAIKEGFGLPVYSITEIGNPHRPKFVSSVNFGGGVFTDGQKRKTRKGNQSPWIHSSAHHSDKEDN